MTTVDLCSAALIAKVFETAEIFEAVLYHLPFGDLLPLQRVNRTWFHQIRGSLPLQQKLFFKPDFGAPTYAMTVRDKGFGLVCGLDQGSLFETYEIMVPTPHPLLQNTTIVQLHQNPPRKHVLQNGQPGSYQVSPLSTVGSWRKQLIAQPPPKKIKIQCTISNSTSDIVVVTDQDGVRLEPVAEVLYRFHKSLRERGRTGEGNVSIVIEIVE